MYQIARMSLLLALVLAVARPAPAQNAFPYNVDTRPKTGFLPDSMVGGVDSIGPANGGLHLNIPIASLPAGDAGMGFQLRLVYNSANYAIQAGVWETPPYGNPTAADLEQYPKYYQKLYGEPGWRYNFQNYRIEEETRDLNRKCSDSDPDFPLYPRVYRTRVGLGDGSLHALHLYGDGPVAGAPVEPEGFYHFSYTGWPHSIWPACLNAAPVDDLFNVRRTLYSSDGSYVKLEIGPNPAREMSEWILSIPDGRQARGTGQMANKLYDANGNWVEFVNACADLICTQPYTAIRDRYFAADPNRQILIEYLPQASGPSDHRITAPTANGTATWTVDLERITVDGGVKTYERTPDDDPFNNEDGDQPVRTRQHVVVSSITYPSTPTTHYGFEYNDGAVGWGEVDKVTAPGGAVTAYTYENDSHRDNGFLMDNPVLKRMVTHGETPDVTTDAWSYAYPYAAFITTNPDGGVVTKTFETGDRERISKIAGPDGLVVERTWAHNSLQSIVGYVPPANNPYVSQVRRSVPDSMGAASKTAITGFSYNANGLLTSRIEYDWVDYVATADTRPLKVAERDTAAMTVKRRVDLTYHYPQPSPSPALDLATGYWRAHNPLFWSDPGLPRRLDAVRRRTVSDGATTFAATEFVYDNAYTTGNVTQEKRWDDVKPASVPATLSAANAQVLTRAHDSRGNLTEIYAPDVHTRITYGSAPNVTGPGPYPTQVVYAPGMPEARTWTYVWDYGAGVLDSSRDHDNGVTTAYAYDALGRSTEVNEAGMRKTVTTYYDDTRRVRTVTDLVTHGDGKLQTIAKHDMLGRVVETRVSDGAGLSTTANASDGIKVTTDYIHTAGSPTMVVTSTPHRATTDPMLEWTCTRVDRLGRTSRIGVFKGAAPPASCAATANRTGLTEFSYDRNMTRITEHAPGATAATVTDVVRDEVRDALGRLTEVTEDPGAGNLAYGTAYAYDPLDNLLTVTQGVQTRTFVYSSLSRLRSATNPESGTTHYCYDDAGNLKSRTDARVTLPSSALDTAGHLICPASAAHATATYVYDDLQRLDTVTYSDTTPNVDYDYHMSGSPNIGQLKSIFSDAAKAIYNSYDTLGRVTSMSQTIAGHSDTFTFGNKYYLNNALKSQTYPSGRTVTYTLDDAGRVKTASDGTTTYADMPASAGHAYAPDGRLQQMKLGNNLWEIRDYHTPGTTTLLKLVTSDEMTMLPGATERVALGYHYSGTANNGNLMTHTITRPGRTQPWTQTFTYDAANRLETARETGGYDREFGYDRYGNRWVKPHPVKPNNGMTQTDMHEPKYATQFDAAKNQLASPPMVDYYDAAGNQTMYSPYTLAYDAENRLKSMTHASSGSGTYLYDGKGRRVKKTWTPGGGTAQDTYYVYDIAGNLAAEYGTSSNSNPPPPATLYPFTDMLGSVRAVTDANGAVIECYDYLPFGRMLSASDNSRTDAACHPSSPDSSFDSKTSQKFTGQVRDEETRLDYFNARYLSAPEGRFLSADPLSGWPGDTQSWNGYAYARNNPLLYTDPTGLIYELCTPEYDCIYDYPDSEFEQNFLGDPAIRIDGPFIFRGNEFIGYARHIRTDNPRSRANDLSEAMAPYLPLLESVVNVAAVGVLGAPAVGLAATAASGFATGSGLTTLGQIGIQGARLYPATIMGYTLHSHAWTRMAQDIGHRIPSAVVEQVIRFGKTLPGRDPGITVKFLSSVHPKGVTVLLKESTKQILSIRIGAP